MSLQSLECLLGSPKIYSRHERARALKDLRKKAGLRQAVLAELAGVNRTTISRIEKGGSEMSSAVCGQITRALILAFIPQVRKHPDDGWYVFDHLYGYPFYGTWRDCITFAIELETKRMAMQPNLARLNYHLRMANS